MSYEIRLDEKVAREIEEFVVERFHPSVARFEAYREVLEALEEVAADPLRVGTTIEGFHGLVSVRRLEIEDIGYPVRIAYAFSEDEKAILILGFSAQAF